MLKTFCVESPETSAESRSTAMERPSSGPCDPKKPRSLSDHCPNPQGSLLDSMDQTVTGGARLLERYLASPERNLSEIRRRQGCVAEFSRAISTVDEIGVILRTGSDLERILGRLRNRLVRPRELGGLGRPFAGSRVSRMPCSVLVTITLRSNPWRPPLILSMTCASFSTVLSRKSCHRRSRSA